MVSEQEKLKITTFVYRLAYNLHFTDKDALDVYIDRVSNMGNINEAMDEIIMAIVRQSRKRSNHEEKMAFLNALNACKADLLAINPKEYGDFAKFIERKKELEERNLINAEMSLEENHKLVHDCMVDFGKMMEDSGLEYYFTGGLVSFFKTNTPLKRYHSDLDIFFNESQLKELKELVDKDENFSLDASNLDTKDDTGHEYVLRYKGTPMSIGLFLYDRKYNGDISCNSYYRDHEDKGNFKMRTVLMDREYANLSFDKGDTFNYEGRVYPTVGLEYLYSTKADSSRFKDLADARMLEKAKDEYGNPLLDKKVLERLKELKSLTIEDKGTVPHPGVLEIATEMTRVKR